MLQVLGGVLLLGTIDRLPATAQSTVWSANGPPSGTWFGSSLATGDVNSDGSPDLIVGASQGDRVHIYLGPTFAASPLFSPISSSAGGWFGCSVATADIDTLPGADIIVGSWRFPWEDGHVDVFSGQSGQLIRSHAALMQSGYDRFGFAVAGVGDLDGDSYGDYVVGAPQGTTPGPGIGYAQVFSGQTGTVILTISGGAWGDVLGYAVGGLEDDVDGDGVPEVLVGAPQINGAPQGPGFVRVCSGQSGAPLYPVIMGTTPGDYFGMSVCSVCDVDNDGIRDFLVGATQAGRSPPAPGYAILCSGATGAQIQQFTGAVAGDHFGASVADAGDVDGDGACDFLIGASLADTGAGVDSGSVYLYSGNASHPASPWHLLATLSGSAAHDNFGHAVIGYGADASGDGLPDFLTSAHKFGSADDGRVELWSLCPHRFNYCVSAPNSTGQGAVIGATGSMSLSTGGFTLTVSQCPANKFGIFYVGPQPTAPLPFGSGYRCVVGTPTVRLGPPLLTSNSGTASYPVNFTVPPGSAITVGQLWYFQFYYRDPVPVGYGWNLSDGLGALFCP
jgi:hypothetical protein